MSDTQQQALKLAETLLTVCSSKKPNDSFMGVYGEISMISRALIASESEKAELRRVLEYVHTIASGEHQLESDDLLGDPDDTAALAYIGGYLTGALGGTQPQPCIACAEKEALLQASDELDAANAKMIESLRSACQSKQGEIERLTKELALARDHWQGYQADCTIYERDLNAIQAAYEKLSKDRAAGCDDSTNSVNHFDLFTAIELSSQIGNVALSVSPAETPKPTRCSMPAGHLGNCILVETCGCGQDMGHKGQCSETCDAVREPEGWVDNSYRNRKPPSAPAVPAQAEPRCKRCYGGTVVCSKCHGFDDYCADVARCEFCNGDRLPPNSELSEPCPDCAAPGTAEK